MTQVIEVCPFLNGIVKGDSLKKKAPKPYGLDAANAVTLPCPLLLFLMYKTRIVLSALKVFLEYFPPARSKFFIHSLCRFAFDTVGCKFILGQRVEKIELVLQAGTVFVQLLHLPICSILLP